MKMRNAQWQVTLAGFPVPVAAKTYGAAVRRAAKRLNASLRSQDPRFNKRGREITSPYFKLVTTADGGWNSVAAEVVSSN